MLKDNVDERIKERIDLIKSGKAKNKLLSDSSYPERQRANDIFFIDQEISIIEELLPEILILIKNIKKYFTNIWDQNNIVASYLLLGKAYKNLQGVILSAKNGKVSSFVELCRSAQEALDLVFVFLDTKGQKHLERWFKGQIITNGDAREIIDKSTNEMLLSMSKDPVLVKDAKRDIYWTYSLFTHSGYGSMLDMIDIFYEDFDYDDYSGFHYTKQYLHLLESLVVNILLGLKNMFLIFKDLENLNKVEKLLSSFSSQFASPEEIIETLKRYKKPILKEK